MFFAIAQAESGCIGRTFFASILAKKGGNFKEMKALDAHPSFNKITTGVTMANSTDKNTESKYRVNEQGMIVEEIDDLPMNATPERLNSNRSGESWTFERKAENYE
jgi:hypothetical protein